MQPVALGPTAEGDGHDHDDLVKANGQPRKLPHRYPQGLVDRSAKLYEQHARKMVDDILEVLTE